MFQYAKSKCKRKQITTQTLISDQLISVMSNDSSFNPEFWLHILRNNASPFVYKYVPQLFKSKQWNYLMVQYAGRLLSLGETPPMNEPYGSQQAEELKWNECEASGINASSSSSSITWPEEIGNQCFDLPCLFRPQIWFMPKGSVVESHNDHHSNILPPINQTGFVAAVVLQGCVKLYEDMEKFKSHWTLYERNAAFLGFRKRFLIQASSNSLILLAQYLPVAGFLKWASHTESILHQSHPDFAAAHSFPYLSLLYVFYNQWRSKHDQLIRCVLNLNSPVLPAAPENGTHTPNASYNLNKDSELHHNLSHIRAVDEMMNSVSKTESKNVNEYDADKQQQTSNFNATINATHFNEHDDLMQNFRESSSELSISPTTRPVKTSLFLSTLPMKDPYG